jgi:hypothetical protein
MLKFAEDFIVMKKFASTTRNSRARWIFIFGVLAGLFLSGGEGVQLFPFPISESGYSENTASVLESNLKSYAYSVHNSGGHSTLLESKFQKDTSRFLPGGHLTFNWTGSGANFCLQSAHNREKADFSHISLVLGSQSDRAPPTV